MNKLYEETLHRLVCSRQLEEITQMDMGKQFGVTQSHYSKMELGKAEITYDFLCKMYAENWDIDYLVTGIIYRGDNELLQRLLLSCEQKEKRELLRLIVWGIEQLLEQPVNETVKRELRAMHLLLEMEVPCSMIYRVRNIRECSQVSMAEALGIGMRKYRKLECGETQPDLELMTKVYHISGCRPSLFIDENAGKRILLNSLWNMLGEPVQKELIDFLDSGIRIMDLKKRG